MTKALHITLAQINPIVGDLTYNLAKIRKAVAEAPQTAELIVFPELAVCGYSPEDLITKAAFLEAVESTVTEIVKDSAGHNMHLLVPAPWRHDGKIYNAVHLIGGGKIVETRFKHNLPNYGVFDEQRVFKSAPLLSPVMFKGHKLGLIICEDMWTPEASQHMKDAGAEMLIVVNASPYDFSKHEQRLGVARARVHETRLPLIYVNQCGGQDEVVFDGASFVLNEQGHLVLQAEEFVEDIHHTVWEKTGEHWLCGTKAISDVHDREESIYQALVFGLRDYVTKNGFTGVLLGLSGGIDSALSAAIAVDALGADAVHCVMMPSQYTTQESLDDAVESAKLLGAHLETISIETTVAALERQLAPHLPRNAPQITFENLQSRARGVMLMALSNATGKMVLTTGNKSEMAAGYATLYGDMCGGFNALKDVYKTDVYRLSAFRNGRKPDHTFGPAGRVIPENTITRAPTAELKPNQTDQDSLPPYDVLDAILTCLIELDLGVAETAAKGFDKALVLRVFKMLDNAEYKRRQAPPGTKITPRAFGRERRYPITNRFSKSV